MNTIAPDVAAHLYTLVALHVEDDKARELLDTLAQDHVRLLNRQRRISTLALAPDYPSASGIGGDEHHPEEDGS